MTAPTTALPNDDAVLEVLRHAVGERTVSVLDLGGGTGVYAVPIARHGHRVLVLDHSNDALATLARRAQAEGVGELVDGRAADLDRLADAITPGSAEVVLCHRILEYVDSPAATLAAATSALAPGGIMSIVVANRPGAVLSRVIAGRFDEAGSILDGASTPQAGARFTAAEITALLEDVGLRVQQVRGVGLIGELNPSASFSVQAKALADRLASDATLAQAAPLLHIIAGRSEHGA